MREEVKSFTDLITWKKAHKFVLSVYKITKDFPKNETYGLTNQLRRAAVSITSNLAEGFNRSTKAGKINFYYMSLASVAEVQSQLLIAKDLNYILKTAFAELAHDSVEVHKLINGLIKSTKV